MVPASRNLNESWGGVHDDDCLAALALALQTGLSLQQGYEGVARDSFAAWSFKSDDIEVSGSVHTPSVQTLYDTPTAFNGNPTQVVYSIHQAAFDCRAQTAAFISGANYTRSGTLISPASPSAALPWTDGTAGFQAVAAAVGAMAHKVRRSIVVRPPLESGCP